MKPHILVFSVDYFPYIGGAEVAVREICRHLPDYRFTLITCRNSRFLSCGERYLGVDIVRVGLGLRRIDKYLFPLLAFFRACRLHSASPVSGVWGIMANPAGLAAMIFKVSHPRLFYALSVQEGESDEEFRSRTWFWLPVFRRVHTCADIVLCASRFLKRRVERIGYAGRSVVIPNGVDLSVFHPIFPRPSRPFRSIVTVSRLVPKNGIADLLRAFSLVVLSHPDAFLTIVGGGACEGSLRALCEDLSLQDHVSFLGGVPYAAVPNILRAADLFVRPSVAEGFGNAFLEAMACGIPVIGADAGAVSELIRDGENGLLCTPHDPASLARAIDRFFSDSELRAACAASGLRIASSHSWDRIAGEVGACFTSLI